MKIAMRDRWKEEDVLDLPRGEQNYFERKSGDIINKGTFDDDLAKALSAFANSGGGHLIIGVTDAGTFDGVPAVLKGRTKTKDWLEQRIPRLLDYSLQEFRVHEVVPGDPTTIPSGKVVIVVDVGDSPLAPHQVANKHVYYYRAGGRSEPAPHFFLDLLWGRQNRYPGQKVARAWLDSVISPALSILSGEQAYLGQETRAFNRLQRSDAGLHWINADSRISPDNLEQFLEFHVDIKDLVSKHDKELVEATLALEQLYDSLLDGKSFLEAYSNITSPKMLESIGEELNRNGYTCRTPEETINAVFGSFGLEHNHSMLAEHIVTRSPELQEHHGKFAKLWNPRRESLLSILGCAPHYGHENEIVRRRGMMLRTVGELIEALKGARRELAIKFGEPYAPTIQWGVISDRRRFGSDF
jgi:hypothetical protein